jgi:hypothetical protein
MSAYAPRHKFVTGATLLQLGSIGFQVLFSFMFLRFYYWILELLAMWYFMFFILINLIQHYALRVAATCCR